MPFFENISLEVSGNDFNLTTNVNKNKLENDQASSLSQVFQSSTLYQFVQKKQ